jgi:hypothetical protein
MRNAAFVCFNQQRLRLSLDVLRPVLRSLTGGAAEAEGTEGGSFTESKSFRIGSAAVHVNRARKIQRKYN